MRRERHWLWTALLLPIFLGVFELGRLVFYSLAPVPEDRLRRALHIVAYQRISCAHARVFDYSETSVTLQCLDREAAQYTIWGQEPCSQTWGCVLFWMLCMYVEKSQRRVDAAPTSRMEG
jgi:hypothetical protein